MTAPQSIVLAGHPFLLTGQGEHIRAVYRSLRAAGVAGKVLDIYGSTTVDPDLEREMGEYRAARLGRGINIFHINGDEVDRTLANLDRKAADGSYNIIYPAWELSRYPEAWVAYLERFDEVWAFTKFMHASLEGRISVPLRYMPVASEARVNAFLGRRYFRISEANYVFLFLFDFTSYMERKNPFAAIRAFDGLIRARPRADVHFVVKLNGSQHRPDDFRQFLEMTAPYRDRMTIIDRTLGENEMKNLIRCCDCFLSLHRSEGFGRGLAEAMFLGKPVIATAYSGNMDFMTPENSFPVNYELIPVAAGAYPHGEGQVWADADVEQAVAYMIALVDDPASGREAGARASRFVRQHLSYRTVGMRYLARFEEILAARRMSTIPAIVGQVSSE